MTPARTRETWVDVAKGVAILLVVLFHAGGYVPDTTTAGRAWEQVNVVLVSVRMPLFFLVSGLFVGKALANQTARRYFRAKPWPPFYLFVLWTLIYGGLSAASADTFGESALRTLLLQTTLWYMAGLAVHMSVAWFIRGLPPAVQIGGAAVVAAPFAVFFPFELGGFAHIPNYFVFFLIGCHGRAALTRLVRGAGWRRAGMFMGASGGLLVVAVALRVLLPDVQELQAVILFALLPVVAVPFVLICCHAIADVPAGQRLAWLGRHTLPVFLLHPLALQLLDALGASALSEQGLIAWVMPLLLTVAAFGVSVLGWHLLEMYAPWLFGPTVKSGRHSTHRTARVRTPEPVTATPAPSPVPARPERLPKWAQNPEDPPTPAIGIRRPNTPPRGHHPPPGWVAHRPVDPPARIPTPRRSLDAPGPVPALARPWAPGPTPVPGRLTVNGARHT